MKLFLATILLMFSVGGWSATPTEIEQELTARGQTLDLISMCQAIYYVRWEEDVQSEQTDDEELILKQMVSLLELKNEYIKSTVLYFQLAVGKNALTVVELEDQINNHYNGVLQIVRLKIKNETFNLSNAVNSCNLFLADLPAIMESEG